MKIIKLIQSEWCFFFVVLILLLQNTFVRERYWTLDNVLCFLSLSVVYTVIMTIIVCFTKRLWVKVFLYVVSFLLCFINLFLFLCFKTIISPATILLLAETNQHESYDFLRTCLGIPEAKLVLFLLFFTISIVFFVEKNKQKWIKSEIMHICFYLLIPLFLHGLYSLQIFYSLFLCRSTMDVEKWVETRQLKPMDNCTNLVYCLFNLNLLSKELKQAEKTTFNVYKQNSSVVFVDSLHLVLVVGESYIKWHSPLYGYYLNTTPNMLNEKYKDNLYVFTDVASPGNTTSYVLKNVFSTNCLSTNEQWNESPFFPAIFNHAGYEVILWDNQYDPKSKEAFDFSLNSYLHNPLFRKNIYKLENSFQTEYDADFVDSCLKRTGSWHPRYGISIIHLMGQHFSYYCRYPHNELYDYYSIDSIKNDASYMTNEKRQVIVDYDNATRYNDNVMKKIFDYYREKNAVIVYFSDHGDEVYDYRDYIARDLTDVITPDLLKYQYSVPFFIWCSDQYKKKYPEIVNEINMSLTKPLMLDNLCHLLFHLGGVKTCYYIPERDVLSEKYNCPARLINGKTDYDEVLYPHRNLWH